MTLRFPLKINQDEAWEVTFPVVDAAGAAANLTGWTGRSQVRRTPTEPVLHEWVATAGNIDLTYIPAAGSTPAKSSVTLRVTAATSLAWTWTRGSYDLLLTDPAGKPTRIVQGSVTVSPATTH